MRVARVAGAGRQVRARLTAPRRVGATSAIRPGAPDLSNSMPQSRSIARACLSSWFQRAGGIDYSTELSGSLEWARGGRHIFYK
jgi:hypothetical protein